MGNKQAKKRAENAENAARRAEQNMKEYKEQVKIEEQKEKQRREKKEIEEEKQRKRMDLQHQNVIDSLEEARREQEAMQKESLKQQEKMQQDIAIEREQRQKALRDFEDQKRKEEKQKEQKHAEMIAQMKKQAIEEQRLREKSLREFEEEKRKEEKKRQQQIAEMEKEILNERRRSEKELHKFEEQKRREEQERNKRFAEMEQAILNEKKMREKDLREFEEHKRKEEEKRLKKIEEERKKAEQDKQLRLKERRENIMKRKIADSLDVPDPSIKFPEVLNVGLYGTTGIGKTSLLNSIRYALHGKLERSAWLQTAPDEFEGGHTIRRMERQLTPGLAFIDNRGIGAEDLASDAASDELINQLEGRGRYKDVVDWKAPKEKSTTSAKDARRIYCTVLVFDPRIMAEVFKPVRTFIRMLYEWQGRYPIGVLTNIDRATEEEMNYARITLKSMGISDIYEIANLTEEKYELEPEYQVTLLKLLERCMFDGHEIFILREQMEEDDDDDD